MWNLWVRSKVIPFHVSSLPNLSLRFFIFYFIFFERLMGPSWDPSCPPRNVYLILHSESWDVCVSLRIDPKQFTCHADWFQFNWSDPSLCNPGDMCSMSNMQSMWNMGNSAICVDICVVLPVSHLCIYFQCKGTAMELKTNWSYYGNNMKSSHCLCSHL